jgi:NAD(P)-dependent dehydrogenase (short-subunit alcohol dehydrogenase family)
MNVASTGLPIARSRAGETALVTGAGSGIGRAVAIALAARHMRVILAGRRVAPLEETAEAVLAIGGTALVHAFDLDDDGACAALAQTTLATSRGELSVLVHSAARYAVAGIEETPCAEFEAIMRTNVHAPFMLTRMLLAALRAARGDLVFINSSVTQNPAAGVTAYAASKAALKALADCLRQEVNKDGVRVLSVFPGRTATPMQARIYHHEGREYVPDQLLQPEDVAGAIAASVCLSSSAELTDLHIRPARK